MVVAANLSASGRIFPENLPSIALHEKLGFRQVGYRERIGKLDGVWRDTVLLERRSKITETHGVNPRAIKVMHESGIDISSHTSNNINEYMDIDFDFVITVCDNAKESCPYFPTKAKKFHYNFPDPAKATGTEEEIMERFRMVSEMIKLYCFDFVQENLKNEVITS